MTAEIAEQRRFKMTFTIDSENNITAHVTPEVAAAATATPFDSFTSEQELAELAVQWPAERLVAIWNSLPGITPVKRFKDRKTAVGRIWTRIQAWASRRRDQKPHLRPQSPVMRARRPRLPRRLAGPTASPKPNLAARRAKPAHLAMAARRLPW
jgi:hypothetical protein